MARFTGDQPDSLIFTSPLGAPLRHGNFRRRVWLPALQATGLGGTHFHDLRHTGNTLTGSATGATLRELMDRMGHRSTRAAMIYLHAVDARQQAIADDLSRLVTPELEAQLKRQPDTSSDDGSGTRRARTTDEPS
jgi:integrase